MSDPVSLLHSVHSLAAAPAFLSGKFWSEFGEVVSRNKGDVQLLATVVAIAVVIVVLLVALWRWRRNHRDFRVYRDEGGVATISPKALRHLIFLACEAVGTAGRPKIYFRQNRGNVDVRIAVRLYQDQRLGEVHERLRQHIRAAFEQTHGISMGEVSLKVTGFKKARQQGDPVSADTAPSDIALLTPSAAGYGAADATFSDDDAEPAMAPASEVTPLAGNAPAEQEGRRRWGLFGRRSEPEDSTLELDVAEETGEAEASAEDADGQANTDRTDAEK